MSRSEATNRRRPGSGFRLTDRGTGTRTPGGSARAFTLIEVLVVVAIIALLVSILLPSLNAARRQAKTAACAVNLRTIGHALVFYLQANQDVIPPAGGIDDAGGGFESLHKYVQKVSIATSHRTSPWLGNHPVINIEWFLCPGDEIPHTTGQVKHRLPDGTVQYVEYCVSYGLNTDLSFVELPTKQKKFGVLRRMSSVRRPSSIVSYCDAGNDDIDGRNTWVLTESTDVWNQTEFEVHHKTGGNFLYCDGHVSYSKVARNAPPQYGLPPFPWAWLPDYRSPGEYDDFAREEPKVKYKRS